MAQNHRDLICTSTVTHTCTGTVANICVLGFHICSKYQKDDRLTYVRMHGCSCMNSSCMYVCMYDYVCMYERGLYVRAGMRQRTYVCTHVCIGVLLAHVCMYSM